MTENAGLDEIGRTVQNWMAAGQRITLSRVAERQGFGSVPDGHLVAINQRGDRVGALLAGTADSLVQETSTQLLNDNGSAGLRLLTAEIHGEQASRAGLTCGGRATILVQNVEQIPGQLWSALATGRPATLTTVIVGKDDIGQSRVYVNEEASGGTTGDLELDRQADDLSIRLLADGQPAVHILNRPDQSLLVEAFVPPPRLVIVGASALAESIVAQARLLGWESKIAPDAECSTAALEWAGPTAALVVLSHDPSVDALVMASAITREVKYIGALGSRRTQAARSDRLRALGVGEDDLARIRGPIGLNLGGRQAAHVALAICAEILAQRTSGDGTPLTARAGLARSSP